MKKLLPLILLLIGSGAGVGAGILLRPNAAVELTDTAEGIQGETAEAQDTHKTDGQETDAADEHVDTADDGNPHGNEYAKLNNQFVVPIIAQDKVTALVVLALSIEVPQGQLDTVYQREPKLRDSFLQVLFDHANVGGFEGNFTDAVQLDQLRASLREVAQRDLGKDVVKDVLILEIARQDY